MGGAGAEQRQPQELLRSQEEALTQWKEGGVTRGT